MRVWAATGTRQEPISAARRQILRAAGGGGWAAALAVQWLCIDVGGMRGLLGRMREARRRWRGGGGSARLKFYRRWEADEGREAGPHGWWRVARVIAVRRPTPRRGTQLDVQVEWAGVDIVTGTAWGAGWLPITRCRADVREEARRMEREAYGAPRLAPTPAVGSRKSPRLAEEAARTRARTPAEEGGQEVEAEEEERTGGGAVGAAGARAPQGPPMPRCRGWRGAYGSQGWLEARQGQWRAQRAWRVRRRQEAAAAEEEEMEADAEEAVEEICFCGTDRHLLDNTYSFEGVWVQCDGCERWCHGECAGLDMQAAEELERYTCPRCDVAGVGGFVARAAAAARAAKRRRDSRSVAVLTLLCPTAEERTRATERQARLEQAEEEEEGSGEEYVTEWEETEEQADEATARQALAAGGGDVATASDALWRIAAAAPKTGGGRGARRRRGGDVQKQVSAVRGPGVGEAGRMRCPEGHRVRWCFARAKEGCGLRCDGGCRRRIPRGGWWACPECDFDVCLACEEKAEEEDT